MDAMLRAARSTSQKKEEKKVIELNRDLEGTVRMIYGKLEALGQMLIDDSCVEVESVNIPNEVGTVPIIALCEGFDDAAKACGAAVSTDESGIKFFITTDQQVIFLDGSNKC